jgi:hypothetical protein
MSSANVFSFERQYPPGFKTNENSMVKDGDTFPIFKSKKVWVGPSDGRSGAWAKYLDTVDTAAERAIAYMLGNGLNLTVFLGAFLRLSEQRSRAAHAVWHP